MTTYEEYSYKYASKEFNAYFQVAAWLNSFSLLNTAEVISLTRTPSGIVDVLVRIREVRYFQYDSKGDKIYISEEKESSEESPAQAIDPRTDSPELLSILRNSTRN